MHLREDPKEKTRDVTPRQGPEAGPRDKVPRPDPWGKSLREERVSCEPGTSVVEWQTGTLVVATNSTVRNWHQRSSKGASPSDSTMYSTKQSAGSSASWGLVRMARASAEIAIGEAMARPLYILKQDATTKGGECARSQGDCARASG